MSRPLTQEHICSIRSPPVSLSYFQPIKKIRYASSAFAGQKVDDRYREKGKIWGFENKQRP
jgi:hypothetical protein